MTRQASACTTRHVPHVAIVGGGITGLTAAWELQKANISYTLLEKSERLGGKVQTDEVADDDGHSFVIERAGDAFLARQKPWAAELALELGLQDEILPTNTVAQALYVLRNGELVPSPKGLQLIIPTDAETFSASPLMSEAGRARVLAEETVAPSSSDADESVADFVRRRLGDEAVELLAEPLLSGIYSARPEEQSLLATFPRYRQLEQKYGSLLGGVRQAQANRPKLATTGATPDFTPFISFTGGTETLTRVLAQRLTGDVRLQSCVRGISMNDGYALALEDGSVLHASHVIVTTPARVASTLLRPLATTAADELGALRTVSTGIIFLAYRHNEITHPLDGFGVVVPRCEGRNINAMTWMSSKFSQRAPDDCVLLRLFFGGARTPHMMAKDDTEIEQIVREEVRDILGISAQPVLRRIYRWIDAQPQYDVGHLTRMEKVHANLPKNVYVAGSPYGGVGIPDCVRQGRAVAREIVNCQ